MRFKAGDAEGEADAQSPSERGAPKSRIRFAQRAPRSPTMAVPAVAGPNTPDRSSQYLFGRNREVHVARESNAATQKRRRLNEVRETADPGLARPLAGEG
jgi:hypothetical protein